MDDFVSQGLSVALCGDCTHRYGRWWASCSYMPDLSGNHLSDCQGCSERLTYVTVFYPESHPEEIVKEG